MRWPSYLILSVVLAGCAGYTRQGLYDAAPVEGWRLIQNRGSSRFISPVHRDRGVVFGTPRRGELLVRFYFPTEGEVKFESSVLRVLRHDGSALRVVPMSSEMTFEVPDTDFTIEIPSFTVGGTKLPPLRPHFTWSDRKYSVAPVE